MTFDIKKIDVFPLQPGVYLMKDVEGCVLYVGKAKNVRQRVKQYFIPGRDGRIMVPYLIAKVCNVETIVVTSEKEALLLENTLIKKHQPKYNALLKDDKTYIALKVTHRDEWPTVQIVRYRGTPEPDGLYFGPYTSAHAARQTLDLLNRLFPLRQCSDRELAQRKRPCLLFQMGRCAGPCDGRCTKAEYDRHVQRVIKFLKGKDKEVLKELYEEMKACAERLEFEKAGELHHSIRQIEKTIEQQHVDRPHGGDFDALGIHRHGQDVVLSQLLFRSGKLTGSRHFTFKRIVEDDTELLASFILQHYPTLEDIPPEILLPVHLEESTSLEEILSKSHRVTLHHPQRGDKKVFVEMAQTNAEALFRMETPPGVPEEKALLEMQEKLGLRRYPSRIDCFDNSHMGGSEPVSALVVFVEGKKASKLYRTYRLREQGKPDDYAAMREVLARRYRRGKEEGDLPDLLIVDGGKGQLSSALQILNELEIYDMDVFGLAKEEGRHDKGSTSEQIFLPGQPNPILLPPHSPILFLLQKIRDEAHRVAITFQRKRRSKQTVRSALDDVPGIGPAKRKALLSHFGSLKAIRAASADALKEVKGISTANIQAIHTHLNKELL